MNYDPSLPLLDLCEQAYFRLNPAIRHKNTKAQYRIALANLSESLGHTATVADLNDDAVASMMTHLTDKGLAPRTINERRNRVHALWHWLCKRGQCDRWPTTGKVPEPQRTPQAWSEKQILQLFQACSLIRGKRHGVPKWLWWQCLLLLLWDTGERIGAILAIRWEELDLETGWLHVPAELRKGAGLQQAGESWREAQESAERREAANPSVKTGDRCILRQGYICTSQEAHDRLLDSLYAKDQGIFEEQLGNGDAFRVAVGTEAILLANGIITCEIRVLDGTNRRGFVEPDSLKHPDAD